MAGEAIISKRDAAAYQIEVAMDCCGPAAGLTYDLIQVLDGADRHERDEAIRILVRLFLMAGNDPQARRARAAAGYFEG